MCRVTTTWEVDTRHRSPSNNIRAARTTTIEDITQETEVKRPILNNDVQLSAIFFLFHAAFEFRLTVLLFSVSQTRMGSLATFRKPKVMGGRGGGGGGQKSKE